MNLEKKLLERVEYLIELANRTIATRHHSGQRFTSEWVNSELFKEFQSLSKSFIINLYGENNPYFKNFEETVNAAHPGNVERGRGILKSIKTEIEQGWLTEIRSLVTSEIFSDFLEMAKYLLDENYKDPAAVMIGSVLEENLRQIALKNGVDLEFSNSKGDLKPKKADTLNADIVKAGAYTKLDQKQVTAWLDLRNKAAHGLYSEYTKEQVNLMYDGVLNFMIRNN